MTPVVFDPTAYLLQAQHARMSANLICFYTANLHYVFIKLKTHG
jgi:hypothetical protein